MAEYQALEEYVVSQQHEIERGDAVVLEVRDADTFERKVVKAYLTPPGGDVTDGDTLVLRNLAENVSSDRWKIRIVEELDPDTIEIRPQSEFRRGGHDSA